MGVRTGRWDLSVCPGGCSPLLPSVLGSCLGSDWDSVPSRQVDLILEIRSMINWLTLLSRYLFLPLKRLRTATCQCLVFCYAWFLVAYQIVSQMMVLREEEKKIEVPVRQ